MIPATMRLAATVLLALGTSAAVGGTLDTRQNVKQQVDAAVHQVMAKYRVPGMAVGVIAGGQSYVFDYGVASAATHRPSPLTRCSKLDR